MKVLRKFNNEFSANIAKGVLESEGVQAYIFNENIGFVTGMANTDLISIQLVVDDSDYEKAKEILSQMPIGK